MANQAAAAGHQAQLSPLERVVWQRITCVDAPAKDTSLLPHTIPWKSEKRATLYCCPVPYLLTGLPEVSGLALLWGLMAAPDAPCAFEHLLGVKLYSRDLADQLELLMVLKNAVQVCRGLAYGAMGIGKFDWHNRAFGAVYV